MYSFRFKYEALRLSFWTPLIEGEVKFSQYIDCANHGILIRIKIVTLVLCVKETLKFCVYIIENQTKNLEVSKENCELQCAAVGTAESLQACSVYVGCGGMLKTVKGGTETACTEWDGIFFIFLF
jgi:hypothetical protein